MTAITRLTPNMLHDLESFINTAALAWMQAGLVERNAFGVEVILDLEADGSFATIGVVHFGFVNDFPNPDPQKDVAWYRANAHGKNKICLATGLDSDVAVRQTPGLVAGIEGAYPWGGAVIDKTYGLIVGVSGFSEDEDMLFARTILNYLIMLLDRHGQVAINDARRRGDQEGEAGADRFIRAA